MPNDFVPVIGEEPTPSVGEVWHVTDIPGG